MEAAIRESRMNSFESREMLLKRTITSFCLVASLTGCFETKQEFTINPDGSGKVVHECRFDDKASVWESVGSNRSLKEAVRDLIQKSKGVDTWRDVTFSRLDDGRAYFRGTAYFRRLEDVDIDDQMAMHFTWGTRPDGTKILARGKSKRDSGKFDRFDDLRSERNLPGTNASPAELAKYARDEQAKYRAMRPMFESFFGRMRHEASFKLPGKISKASIFIPVTGNQLTVVLAGTNIMRALDTLITDEEQIKRNLTTTNLTALKRDFPDEEGNGFIFGKKAPLEATVSTGNNPLFDYDAEVQAARSDFAKLQKDLQITVASIMPAAGAGFKSLHVVGIRLDDSFPEEREFEMWGRNPGLRLTLLGQFPGTVQALTKNGVVKTALSDDGRSLLPDSIEAHGIESFQLSKDKTAILFSVSLKLPDKGARVIRELSGQLQYHSEAGAKEIDLGFDGLREGARGTELGAHIKAMKPHWNEDALVIEVSLNLRLEAIKEVYLVVGGTKTALRRTMSFGGGDVNTIGLVSKWAVPAGSRLVVLVVDRVQPFDVPFKLQNIALPQLTTTTPAR